MFFPSFQSYWREASRESQIFHDPTRVGGDSGSLEFGKRTNITRSDNKRWHRHKLPLREGPFPRLWLAATHFCLKGRFRLAEDFISRTSLEIMVQARQSGNRYGEVESPKQMARFVKRVIHYGDEEIYSFEDLPILTCVQQENRARKPLELKLCNLQGRVVGCANAERDTGATRCIIARSWAEKVGWRFALKEGETEVDFGLQPLVTLTGEQLKFLGLCTINAVVTGTGQRFRFEAQVAPDEEMRACSVHLIIGESVLDEVFGECGWPVACSMQARL